MTKAPQHGWWRIWALLLVVALTGAACADDDDDQAQTGDRSTTSAASGGEVEGCGEEAATDPSDLSADRQVARCEPGAPAPQPLAERQTIRLSSAFRAEFVAPILLAEHFGEFEKENLDFEFVELGFSDALPQIAQGELDMAVGGTEAAFFNAINRDIGVQWALANFYPPDAGNTDEPQTGLWVRRNVFSDPASPDLAELEGERLASAVGLGSVIAYPIALAFEDAGVSLLDLQVEQIPSPDMVQALRNEAVAAAWLLDPYWIEASQDESLALVATQPPGEPLGGVYFGEHLFTEKREAALAFVRAYIRTVNTYLDGDYQADQEVMAALAEATGTAVESLALTPALVFDWEIRDGTARRTQEFFIEFDTVEYDSPIPEDEVVDRTLYLEAVGAG